MAGQSISTKWVQAPRKRWLQALKLSEWHEA